MRNIWSILAIIVLGAGSVVAETIHEAGTVALSAYDFDPAAGLLRAQQGTPPVPMHDDAPIYEYDTKSTTRAFVYSLLVPGWGQYYNGSKLKAAAFLGVEVLSWTGWLHFRSKGNGLTDDYEAFADAHWYEQPYWDSLKSVHEIDKWQDGGAYPHHLPFEIEADGDTVANHNHEYYENIGKYDQFVWGWDDLTRKPPGQDTAKADQEERNYQSARRLEYVVMREDANRQFDRARAVGIVIIANHLVSAFEAALSARRYNRSAERAQTWDVDVKMVNLEGTPAPWVNVAYRF